MPATITLPTAQQMVASQTLSMFVFLTSLRLAAVMTLAAASGYVKGTATLAVGAPGLTIRHDGLKTLYLF
jgi:hypothetical protein